jgi:hypothetical protein
VAASPAIGVDGGIALFRVCNYYPVRHMLARIQQDYPMKPEPIGVKASLPGFGEPA